MLDTHAHKLCVSWLALSVCLLGQWSSVHGALLGIDFGTERVKVASVAPGRLFDIVLDETSKRAHPNLVVFDEDVRHYGSSGAGLVSRRPLNAFLYYTRALGKRANSTLVSDLRKSYILNEISEDPLRHSVRFASPYYDASTVSSSSESDTTSNTDTSDGDDSNPEESGDDGSEDAEESKATSIESYTVEELAAMKLIHIKQRAEESESGRKAEVRDCVMTVPAYYSDKERQALLDSAQLAGLNVLSLVNENTAAAVMFALNRDSSENATTNSSYFVFFNLGSFSTQVSLIRFFTHDISTGKYVKKTQKVVAFEVIQHDWDEFLGGVQFDRLISDMIYTRIGDELTKLGKSQSEKETVLSNTRTLTSIRSAATKAKIVLSANKETRVYMESLLDGDRDFGTVITRQEFESEMSTLLDRVTAPIDRIVKGSRMASFNITADDIEGIVLIGGGARVPLVKEKLAAYFEGRDLLTTLNADEAPVMGSVFRAANLSSSFQPKHVGMDDILSFPVGVHVSDLNADAEQASEDSSVESDDEENSDGAYSKRGHLFDMYNRLHKKRSLSLKHTKDLKVELYYETEDADGNEVRLPTDTTPELVEYEITGVERAVRKYMADDTSYNVTDKPKVALSFLLDQNSQVQLVSATAIFQEQVMVKVQKDSSDDGESKKKSKKKKGKKSKKDSTDSDKSDDTNESEESSPSEDQTESSNESGSDSDTTSDGHSGADSSTEDSSAAESENEEPSADNEGAQSESSDSESENSDGESEKKEEEPVQYESKTRKHRVALKINRIIDGRTVLPYSAKDFDVSLDVLDELEKRDNAVRATANAQNALESYIYESRSRVYEDDVEKVSTEDERDEIIGALTQAEDWIWESEEEKTAKVFKLKLNSLKSLTKDVFRRSMEMELRPKSVQLAQKSLKQLYEFIEILKQNYTWIKESEVDRLEETTKSTEEWLSEKIDEQKGKSLTENPAFYSSDIDMRMGPLMKQATKLMKSKPSKEWKKAQREKAKQAAEAEKNATDADGASNDAGSEADSTNEEGSSELENDEQSDSEQNGDDNDDSDSAESADANEEDNAGSEDKADL